MNARPLLAATVAVSVAAAHGEAQLGGVWSRSETGVSLSATRTRSLEQGLTLNAPVGIGVAYVRDDTPWGGEIALDFGGERSSNAGELKELRSRISLARRLGRGRGPHGTSGTYLTLGLAQTHVQATRESRGTVLRGYALGFGPRIAIGRSGVLRTEAILTRDWGRDIEGRKYPGAFSGSFRVSMALRNDF